MVRLRRNGAKLSRDEVRACRPVRGDLSVHMHRGVRQAILLPAEGRADPLVLEDCILTQMRGESFLVVGHEVEFRRGDTLRSEQAWWCRLPDGMAMPPGLDVTPTREERRAARALR